MSIKPLNQHYSFENQSSIYDEEALTALELAGRTTAKINETVTAFNNLEVETNAHLAQQDASIPVKIADKVQEHIDNGRFDEQVDKYAGNLEAQIGSVERTLSARMDGFTSLPDGSTAGDAEMTDARTSDMGHNHTNLGGVLRTNFPLFRNAHVPSFVDEMGVYSRFEYKYRNGNVNGGKDCLSIHPPVKFDHMVHIRPLTGYQIAVSRFSDEAGTTFGAKDSNWTTGVIDLEPEYYHAICVNRVGGGKISLDEGYAVQFFEPFYNNGTYGEALNTIYPLMRIGGFALSDENAYSSNYKDAMYSKGGFTLRENTVLHCDGEANIAFHRYSDNKVSNTTYIGDSGWQKELIIPANTFGVLYFRKGPDRPLVTMDDIKMIKLGPAPTASLDMANKTRAYATPNRKSICHRGWSNYGEHAPENTLPAFRLAKLQGFDYVEMDVRITTDGVPVVCHDTTVDRTSNGSGAVANMTLEQLKALDFSDGCDVAKYAGTKMPTLEEALITCKNLGINVYLEIEPECLDHEATIVQLVKDYSMENAVTYISFSSTILSKITKLDEYAPVGLLKDGATADTVTSVKSLRTGFNDAFLNARDNITGDVMALCRAEGVPVEIWCVGATAMLGLDPYVRGVTSDTDVYKTVMYNKEMEGV